MSDSSPSLVDLVASASAEDLQQIDHRIAELESKRQDLDNQVEALHKLRGIINIRLNGKPSRAPRGLKGKKGANSTTATNSPNTAMAAPTPQQATATSSRPNAALMIQQTIQQRGTQTIAALASLLGMTPAAVSRCVEVNSDVFRKGDDGLVRLASMVGRQSQPHPTNADEDSGEMTEMAKKVHAALAKGGAQSFATMAMNVGTTHTAVGRCVASRPDLFRKSSTGMVDLISAITQ